MTFQTVYLSFACAPQASSSYDVPTVEPDPNTSLYSILFLVNTAFLLHVRGALCKIGGVCIWCESCNETGEDSSIGAYVSPI